MPTGVPYHHCTVKAQAVNLTFLNCYLSELMAYYTGLMALRPMTNHCDAAFSNVASSQPTSAMNLSPVLSRLLQTAGSLASLHPANSGVHVTQAAHHAFLDCTGILVDIEMHAPVIVVPKTSMSTDWVELDLGVLTMSNKLERLPMADTAIDILDMTLNNVRTAAVCHHEQWISLRTCNKLAHAWPLCLRLL